MREGTGSRALSLGIDLEVQGKCNPTILVLKIKPGCEPHMPAKQSSSYSWVVSPKPYSRVQCSYTQLWLSGFSQKEYACTAWECACSLSSTISTEEHLPTPIDTHTTIRIQGTTYPKPQTGALLFSSKILQVPKLSLNGIGLRVW